MRRWIPALLILGFNASGLGAQDGKIKIENVVPQGQKATVTMESVMPLMLEGKSTADTKTSEVSLVTKEKFTHEVVLPNRVRIVCESSSTRRNANDIPNPASGKTFYLDSSGGKRSVQTDEGNPFEDPFADHLGRWLDVGAVLPPNEVAKGDTWTSDLSSLGRTVDFNFELPALQVQCTLEDVKDNLATIRFKWDYDGKSKGKALVVSMTGDLVMDIAKKRPVTIRFNGSFTETEDMIEIGRNANDRTSEQNKLGTVKIECKRFFTTVSLEYAP